jgi:glucose-6-phosphate isomerase
VEQAEDGVRREAAWSAIEAQRRALSGIDMRALFAADPQRAGRLRLDAAGLTLDYSKNLIDERALALLLQLAEACGVDQRRREQLGGAILNNTEGRAVLHTALRGTQLDTPLPQASEIAAARSRMAQMVARVRAGQWQGWSGEPVRDIVNIGIGGSHLGPSFVTEALGHLHGDGTRGHFVSNVDPRDIESVLQRIAPRQTLFIVASKTFSTLETLENALSARRWLQSAGCPEAELGRHFVAVSSNVQRAMEFGIAPAHVLPMWDWVGGRYSLWSAIGLPIAMGVGMEHFDQLLAGAHQMDLHFRDAPAAANMPVLLALLSVWYRNAWGCGSQAVIPYDQGLARLPEFLQQLVMESNGKSVDRSGAALVRASSGVVWGAPGTNGQHSFHQMLHQGSDIVPVDFILPLQSHSDNTAQHAHLVANCIAQSQALMIGRTREESAAELRARGMDESAVARLAPHLVMPGNRPSNTILMPRLTPHSLGALLALYEHRTAVEGYLWDLNSFDQYGVELGKRLGEAVHKAMQGAPATDIDASTAALIAAYRQSQGDPDA